MQVVLVMFREEGERRSFSIVRDVTVIGRREDCDFRIPLGEISRKHCRLIKDGNALRAEDLGSSNGTYVNGNRVQEAELQPGDTLKVGSVVFVVQIDGVPADEDLQPAAPAVAAQADDMSAPTSQHEVLDPTAQVNAAHGTGHEEDMAVEAGDELVGEAGDHPTVDEQTFDEPASADAGDQYDPMSILEVDPYASSIGSMMDDDRIAEDLIVEMESNDQAKKKI
jgi:predicted component of type VI protein secretion system